MEPSVQPSFTFPSRKVYANLADGLQAVINTQQLTTVPKYATDINLESTFYNTLTVPPTLDKESIDWRATIPVAPPIYVQPRLAEGIRALAESQQFSITYEQMLSANNCLKRGNYKAAEFAVGRPLTAEEIANKTITPNIRASENGEKAVHVGNHGNAMGVSVNRGPSTHQGLSALRLSSRRFIVDLAAKLGVTKWQDVAKMQSRWGKVGDLDFSAYHNVWDAEHSKAALDAFEMELKEKMRLSQNEKINAETLHQDQVANKKAAKQQEKEEAARARRQWQEYKASEEKAFDEETFENDEEYERKYDPRTGKPMEPPFSFEIHPIDPNNAEEQAEALRQYEEELKGEIKEEYDTGERRWIPLDENNPLRGPSQGPLRSVFPQAAVSGAILDAEMKANEDPAKTEAVRDNFQTGADPNANETERRMGVIAHADLDVKEEVKQEAREAPSETVNSKDAPMTYEEIAETVLNAPTRAQREVNEGARGTKRRAEDEEFDFDDPPALKRGRTEIRPSDMDITKKKEAARKKESKYLKAFYRHETSKEREERYNRVRDIQALKSLIVKEITENPNGRYRRVDPAAEEAARLLKRLSDVHEHHHATLRERNAEDEEEKEQGSGFRRKARKNGAPKKIKYSRTRWYDQGDWDMKNVSGYFASGAPASGELMRRTGHDAVPISAQIQVPETHQFTERPLRTYAAFPNVDEVSKYEPQPIPISTSKGPVGIHASHGRVHFGQYRIHHGQLQGEGILNLAHSNGRKVAAYPNQRVSKGVKSTLLNILGGKLPNMKSVTNADRVFLAQLLKAAKAQGSIGEEVNVPPEKQLKLILGEMEAGNDSPVLKRDLKKILPQLKRMKLITPQHVEEIKKAYLM
jgi:hypothetical protein